MSIIKHVTLQKIVAHDFRYDPRILQDDTRSLQCQVSTCYLSDDIATEVMLQVFLFCPVSIIPPMLDTHSFIYDRHCIILASDGVVK